MNFRGIVVRTWRILKKWGRFWARSGPWNSRGAPLTTFSLISRPTKKTFLRFLLHPFPPFSWWLIGEKGGGGTWWIEETGRRKRNYKGYLGMCVRSFEYSPPRGGSRRRRRGEYIPDEMPVFFCLGDSFPLHRTRLNMEEEKKKKWFLRGFFPQSFFEENMVFCPFLTKPSNCLEINVIKQDRFPKNFIFLHSQISWIRHHDLHILTVGRYTYTADLRYQSIYNPERDEWILQVGWHIKTNNKKRRYTLNLQISDQVRPEARLWPLRVPDQHPAGQELLRQPQGCRWDTCLMYFAKQKFFFNLF